MIFLVFSLSSCISVDKIRGVSPVNAGQYRRAISVRKGTFTCFDKLKTLNVSRINDGYCDCDDGSDEPGTNACGTGEFYCRNTGSVPKVIPKWMVDDGVCDCCDGSDEEGNPHAHCEDVCGTIRKRSIEFRANLTNLTIEGGKLRTKYSERGRLELNVRRKQLQLVEVLKAKVNRASSVVEQIYWERKSGGEATEMITQLELIMSELDKNFDEIEKSEKNLRKGTRKIKEDVPHYGRFNLKHRTEWHFNVENAICWLPDFSYIFYRLKSAYDICKEFLDAYKDFQEPDHPTSLFNKLSAITSKIENSTAKVTTAIALDFGSDKEFVPLYKQWYYFEQDGYYIEFYPFVNATKRSKGESVLIGAYNRSEPFRWYFTDGSHCRQNRGKQALEVRLHCRMKDEILSFREWATCQYRMDFGTPAVCVDEYRQRVEAMDDVTLDEWAKDAGLYK